MRKKWRHKNEPTKDEWIDAATHEARLLRIDPQLVLDRDRHDFVVLARIRAWRRLLLDAEKRFTIAGVARVSGHDHTTILSGLRNYQRLRARVIGRRWRERKKVLARSIYMPPPEALREAALVRRELAYRDAWRASLGLGRHGKVSPQFVYGASEP